MLIDIPRVIEQLEERGLSDTEIALRSQIGKATLSRWKSGERAPSFEAGLRLLIVHLKFFPESCPLATHFGLQPREGADFQDQLLTGGNDDRSRRSTAGD